MADKKRYQIFVSSTFEDLKEERKRVMETILNFNCFPAGMELFPAMDEEQFEFIKRKIDESDYYLLIIGGRYGSVDDSYVSWTEREYHYAVDKDIPVIAFIHNDFSKLPGEKTDPEIKKRRKLVAFKKKVSTGRLIQKWSNVDDLDAAVARSLHNVLEQQPRIGWVRADKIASEDVQKEIERLKKEIASRQHEINNLEARLNRKDTYLTKKDEAYNALKLIYHAAKLQIELLNQEIKELKSKLEKSLSSVDSKPDTETFTVNGVSFKMVHVDGGTFMMGADDGDERAFSDEKPAHQVTLSDYWIGETLVTQALWQAVMGKNPSWFNGDPNLPVEHVSWKACQIFIQRINELTGKRFGLPTEAQWEFAARGGNLGKDHHYRYAGSNSISDVAWFKENSKRTTDSVGKMTPNELGLYDMSGNVWEWCNDWFDDKYYEKSQIVDPTGPATGSERVIRGGSWVTHANHCRVTNRNAENPTLMLSSLGLRLAL